MNRSLPGDRSFRSPTSSPLPHRSILAPALLSILLLPAAPLAGQGWGGGAGADADSQGRPPIQVGGAFLVGQPLGEFSDYVQAGFGADGFARVALDPEGWLSLRLDLAFLVYGSETRRVCLSETVGCRIQVDLTTSNQIFSGGIGPELQIPLGTRGGGLYGGLSAGFSWFSTESRVQGTQNVGESPFASTQNFSDGGFAWGASGGVRIPLVGGETPVALDLGLRRLASGRRDYLTEGDIVDRPDGSLDLNVRSSDADLLLWRIGVSVGLRPR
jgi:hypothetical protein